MTKARLIQNMSNADYHASKAVSSTHLKTIASKSLAHYIHNLNNPITQTDALAFGAAYHKIILEPETFEKEFFVIDDRQRPEPDKDYRTAKNRAWKQEQIAVNAGKTMISSWDYNVLKKMQEVIFNNLFTNDLIKSCTEIESSIFSEINGVEVRVRPDGFNDKIIIDLKSTDDCSPDGFARSSASYFYHLQAAFYSDVVQHIDDKPRQFVIIAQEKTAPYVAQIYVIPDYVIAQGRHEYEAALEKLKNAYETGEFPAYESKEKGGIRDLSLPNWAMREVQA